MAETLKRTLTPELPGTDYINTTTASAEETRIHDASVTVSAILKVREGVAWAGFQETGHKEQRRSKIPLERTARPKMVGIRACQESRLVVGVAGVWSRNPDL
jgi:hypothetical protein